MVVPDSGDSRNIDSRIHDMVSENLCLGEVSKIGLIKNEKGNYNRADVKSGKET